MPNSQFTDTLFLYDFYLGSGKGKSNCCRLTVPVTLPLTISPKEYALRLFTMHSLPCFLEEDLVSSFESFMEKETKAFQNTCSKEIIRKLIAGDCDIQHLADLWDSAYTEEHTEYAKPEEISNEEVFSKVYHSLVHSPAMGSVLTLEQTYAAAVSELVRDRDMEIENLTHVQTIEMKEAVQGVGISVTDDQVNSLAAQQFETAQLVHSGWDSQLCDLRHSQRKEFREWVMMTYEDMQTSNKPPSPVPIPLILPTDEDGHEVETDNSTKTHPSFLEESFTIHLGAQMKQMHNLRLIAMDVLDLCRHHPQQIGSSLAPQPQRLQTAMSLYSNSLCGVVLLVDERINSYSGLKRDFASVCQQSTEFHFLPLEDQLETICGQLESIALWRKENPHLVEEFSGQDSNITTNPALKSGDFYITRHSNLAEVHVMFHMVSDDTLRSGDINSRHPVILGLRNVLKAACMHDITTITIPLLLVHEMSEEMTIPWCVKRAELVYKCVKGFMMEMASWGGSETKTLQFLVPKEISEELFNHLSTMLPSIFRMSNPLVLKSSPLKKQGEVK